MSRQWFVNLFDYFEDHNSKGRYKEYVYVISKMFGKENYFKIGLGTISEGRLKQASTYLAPPMSDKGFKIHMIVFYPNSPYKMSYARRAESHLHKTMSVDFMRVPHITSSKDSEWFFVKSERKFMSEIKKELKNIKLVSKDADYVSYYEFRASEKVAQKFDVTASRRATDIVKIAKEAQSKAEKAKKVLLETKGNTEIYKKLIGVTFKTDLHDDGKVKEYIINDVGYSNKYGTWIADLKLNKKLRKDKDETYVSSIGEVLDWIGKEKRKDLKLESNFKYWNEFRKNITHLKKNQK